MRLDDNTIILCINVVITIISLFAAIRSWKYYNKSKILSEYTQLNKAMVEIGKILNKLPEALSAINENKRIKYGYNLLGVIGGIGKEIQSYYNELNACIPTRFVEDFQKLQSEPGFNIQKYIIGYISGEAIKDDILDSGDFAKCQRLFVGMQNYIKKCQNETEEKLK